MMTPYSSLTAQVFYSRFASYGDDPLMRSARSTAAWLRSSHCQHDACIVPIRSKRTPMHIKWRSSESPFDVPRWVRHSEYAIWWAAREPSALGLYLPARTALDLKSGFSQTYTRPVLWVLGDVMAVMTLDTLESCVVVGVSGLAGVDGVARLRGPTATALAAQPIHVVLTVEGSRAAAECVYPQLQLQQAVERFSRVSVFSKEASIPTPTTKIALRSFAADMSAYLDLVATPRSEWLV